MWDEPVQPLQSPVDVDLACPTCRYNLHGLAGDPVRCPECGNTTTLSELVRRHVAEAGRRRAAWQRWFALGPSLCSLASGVALVLTVVSQILWDFFEPLIGPPYAICVAIWIAGALTFVVRARKWPGWPLIFLRHQAIDVPVTIGNALAVLVLTAAGTTCLGLMEAPPFLILVAFVAGVLLVLIFKPMRWLAARAKRQLEPLIDAAMRTDDGSAARAVR